MKKKYYGCICCRDLKNFGMNTTFQVELSNSTDIAYFETIARKMEKKYIEVTEERPLIRLQKKKGTENKEVIVLGEESIDLCNSFDSMGTILHISIEPVKQINIVLLTSIMKKDMVKEALSDFNRLLFPGDFKYKGAKTAPADKPTYQGTISRESDRKTENEEEAKMFIENSIGAEEKRITDDIKEMTMELDRKIDLSNNTPKEYKNIPGVEESVVSAIVVDIDKMISELTDIKNAVINERVMEVIDMRSFSAKEIMDLPKGVAAIITMKHQPLYRAFIMNKGNEYMIVSEQNIEVPIGRFTVHNMYACIDGFAPLKVPADKTLFRLDMSKDSEPIRYVQQGIPQFAQPVNPPQAHDGVEGPSDYIGRLSLVEINDQKMLLGDADITIDVTVRPYKVFTTSSGKFIEVNKPASATPIHVRRLYDAHTNIFTNAYMTIDGVIYVSYPQGQHQPLFQRPPMFGGPQGFGSGNPKQFI